MKENKLVWLISSFTAATPYLMSLDRESSRYNEVKLYELGFIVFNPTAALTQLRGALSEDDLVRRCEEGIAQCAFVVIGDYHAERTDRIKVDMAMMITYARRHGLPILVLSGRELLPWTAHDRDLAGGERVFLNVTP